MTYANPWDWVSPSISVLLLIIGTILFPMCFWIQQFWWKNTATGRAFTKAYQLTQKDTIDISNKIVSAIQALCAGVSGVIIVSHCHGQVLQCRQTWTLGYAWFGIPYFMYDTLCMYYVYTFTTTTATTKTVQHNSEQRRNTTTMMRYLLSKAVEFGRFAIYSPVIFIHHVFMAHIGWTLILFYRDAAEPGDFFVGVMYMMEFSTPFVSIRFILSKLKMKSSIWYAVNGIIMLIAFPIFRILSVLYAALLFTWQNNHGNLFQGIMAVPFHWRTIWMIAMTPQLYWYYLMVRGVVKMYSSPKLKEKKETDEQAAKLLQSQCTHTRSSQKDSEVHSTGGDDDTCCSSKNCHENESRKLRTDASPPQNYNNESESQSNNSNNYYSSSKTSCCTNDPTTSNKAD